MSRPSVHLPELAIPMGTDGFGNEKFQVQSGSTPGYWYDVLVHPSGTVLCNCPAFPNCGMARAGAQLLEMARLSKLANEMLDLSAGIVYNIQEGMDVLDDDTAYRARKLLERSARELEALGYTGPLDPPDQSPDTGLAEVGC